jgi:hypothetical protein
MSDFPASRDFFQSCQQDMLNLPFLSRTGGESQGFGQRLGVLAMTALILFIEKLP